MPPAFRLAGPVLDAADPTSLAAFYERLTGWPIVRSEGPRPGKPARDGWALLRSPDGSRKIEVQWEPNYRPPTWPSVAGDQLMMMHLDFGVDDLDDAEWGFGYQDDWDPQDLVYRDRRGENNPTYGKDPRLTLFAVRRAGGRCFVRD